MTADSKPEGLFALEEAQRARVAVWRAWWEEGEERFQHWELRDQDENTSERVRALLQESGFADGGDLRPPQLDRLFRLLRQLAPNRNLDRRLYTGAGEPATFNRLLRDLLYGPVPLAQRLAAFVERKGVGAQTVTQFLSPVFPARYPLLAPTALASFALTREQRQAASAQAEAEYDGDDYKAPPLVEAILRDFVIYHTLREESGLATYLELFRLLQSAPREAPSAASFTSSPHAKGASVARVREERSGYPASTPSPSDKGLDSGSDTEKELLQGLEQYVAAQGFTYPPLLLRNYYVALKTKPFVILSGLSGTGKTQLTRLFAAALTGNIPQQYLLLPVRPDWTDSTALLGYHNILAGPEGRYVSTRFLDFLREAGRRENAGRAYFVCLDEMNLARVEHYFADLLSALEMPQPEITLQSDKTVPIPPNFFVTGSVNVDETTYAFSRKVLDRANTIEFREVDLSALGSPSGIPPVPDAKHWQALFLAQRVPDVATAQRKLDGIDVGLVERVLSLLTALNEALSLSQLPFGYRVRNEVLLYIANSFDVAGEGLLDGDTARNLETALDFQILQKVLPRLSGTQEQIETGLRAGLLFLLPEAETTLHDAARNLRVLERQAEESRFPRSTCKLARLLARLQRDGYANFYEG